jgi:hypothetical protein
VFSNPISGRTVQSLLLCALVVLSRQSHLGPRKPTNLTLTDHDAGAEIIVLCAAIEVARYGAYPTQTQSACVDMSSRMDAVLIWEIWKNGVSLRQQRAGWVRRVWTDGRCWPGYGFRSRPERTDARVATN